MSFPDLVVEIAFPRQDAETTNFFVLNVDKLDGPAELGPGAVFNDVSADVREVRIRRGRNRPTDAYDAGTATITLFNWSGDYDPRNTASPYYEGGATGIITGIPLRISAVWAGVTYRLFTGVITRWRYVVDDQQALAIVECADLLQELVASYFAASLIVATTVIEEPDEPVFGVGIASVNTSSSTVQVRYDTSATPETAGTDELSGARLNRILDRVGFPGELRNFENGLTEVTGDQELTGTIYEQIEQVIKTEQGTFFADGEGVLTFYERLHQATAPRSSTPQATFSGTVDALNLEPVYDDILLATQVTTSRITAETGEGATILEDPVAVQLYGRRNVDRRGLLYTTYGDMVSGASMRLALYNAPQYQPTRVTIRPGSADVWADRLPLRFLDQVVVDWNARGGVTHSDVCLIEGVEHDITPGDWLITYDLSPWDAYGRFMILDDNDRGILDTNLVAG